MIHHPGTVKKQTWNKDTAKRDIAFKREQQIHKQVTIISNNVSSISDSVHRVLVELRSVQFSPSVVSDSLWPRESQHARPPCPSPTPGVYSYSCPLSRWCHPALSPSVVPFSSYPQSLPEHCCKYCNVFWSYFYFIHVIRLRKFELPVLKVLSLLYPFFSVFGRRLQPADKNVGRAFGLSGAAVLGLRTLSGIEHKPSLKLTRVVVFSCVRPFATPWAAACQASLSLTISRSLPKFMSVASVMLSSHLILCRPLLLFQHQGHSPSLLVIINKIIICFHDNLWTPLFPGVFTFTFFCDWAYQSMCYKDVLRY